MKGSATALIVGTLATALAAEPALFRANARHDGNYDAAGVPVLCAGCRHRHARLEVHDRSMARRSSSAAGTGSC